MTADTTPRTRRLDWHGCSNVRDLGGLRTVDGRETRWSAVVPGDTPDHGVEDTEFWAEWAGGPQFGTPLYYRPHLERFQDRNAREIAAVARAGPGGVLIHCVGGRDRAGQIAVLLLALAGVAPDEIVADYCLSGWAEGDEFLAREGTSAREVILSTLTELDVEAYLRAGGATDRDLAAVRARL